MSPPGTPFPIDRAHPPRRIVFHDDARHLVLRPWTFDDVDGMVEAIHASLPELRAFEVGYWIRSSHTGRGWATLAVRMAIVLAFDWLACDRVQVSHDEANTASQRVVEKCGFSFEGVARNLTARVPAEAHRDGYRGTRRHRTYAITSEDLATPEPALAWLEGIRAGLTVVDALGQERRA